MADHERAELPSDDVIISEYLEPDRLEIGIDRVQTRSGVYVGWIVGAYQRIDPKEGNKIGKTAAEFRIPDIHVLAALRYYNRHKIEIDARVLLNRVHSENHKLSSAEICEAEAIIESSQGQTDPLFLTKT